MKVPTAAFTILLLLTCAPTSLLAQTPPPIIDMDLHADMPPDIPAGAPALCRPEPCRGEGAATADPAETLQKTLQIPPNDPSLEPDFELAEQLDLPVLIHTLGIGPFMRSFRSAAGSPLLLEDVLVRHPKLRGRL